MYLEQYKNENNEVFEITVYHSSFDFLEEYRGNFEVIFLDIEMPGSNGIEVAREIRKKDQTVGIIFITSMAQYAIEGYEVNAVDYMVKPVGYYNFSQKLQKAFDFINLHREKDLVINTKDALIRLRVSEIDYIEKEKDFIVYHTLRGAIQERGSLKVLRDKLDVGMFSECTRGCLINLSYVNSIKKDIVCLTSGQELPISRRLRKQFTEDYIRFMGEC